MDADLEGDIDTGVDGDAEVEGEIDAFTIALLADDFPSADEKAEAGTDADGLEVIDLVAAEAAKHCS